MFGDETTVIVGTIAATALTVGNQLLNGTPTMRPIIGGFVVGTFLLIISLFSTPIAAALALLILVTSVMNNGVPILEKVMGF